MDDCRAPCGRAVPVSEMHRLAGRTIMLPAGRTEVRLRVSEAENSGRSAGYALIAIGAAAFFGLGTALVGSLQGLDGDCGKNCATGSAMATRMKVGGLTAGGIGAALAIAGLVLATRPTEMTVTMSRGAPFTWRF